MIGELFKGISIVLYEAVCCNIFLGIFLKQRYSSKPIKIISVVLLSVLFLAVAALTGSQEQYIFRCLGGISIIFLFSMILYLGKWQMKLFFSGVYYVLLYVVDYFSFIILELIFKSDHLENDFAEVILILLCKTILFCVVLVLEYFWKRKKNLQMENPSWILMICFPVLSMIIMFVMLFSFQGRGSSVGYLIVSFGIVIMNVVMFEWMQYISEKNNRWNQIKLLQERNEERIQIYNEISADYEEQKRAMHDYKNQIGCIQGLLKVGNYQEAGMYADKLVDVLPDVFEGVDVQNPILNVVLTQKYRMAKMKDISIIFHANNLSDLWLEEQDIVSLLSNLLDNAIEACEKVEGDKVIQIKMVRERMEFVLSVRNPVSAPVLIENNQIRTGKKDTKRHGIGLKNVQMILEKYGGMGMIRYEEGYFYYTAVIPE